MNRHDRLKWAGLFAAPIVYEAWTMRRGHGALSETLRWAGRTDTRAGKVATWAVIGGVAAWLGMHLTRSVAEALEGLHDVEEGE